MGMNWASSYIKHLKNGSMVKFRPKGKSMSGLIESGQLITVEPITEELTINDIVLCQVNKSQFVHLIISINEGCYLIGNNKGRINGWISAKNIYGKVTNIEP